jgi:F0F1-type ATP synthase membrane subunit b/b'
MGLRVSNEKRTIRTPNPARDEPGKHEETVVSDIVEASQLPELAKAEQEERNRTEQIERDCAERLEAARRDCRAELDEIPRTIREQRREIVDDATAKADCEVDQVVVTMKMEVAAVHKLAEDMSDELVASVMDRILPASPECQRKPGDVS